MMVIEVPLEPIPTRYTEQWRDWFGVAFTNGASEIGALYLRADGLIGQPSAASNADFLNPITTNVYKAEQTAQLMYMICDRHGKFPDEPIKVFLHDLWHPVVTQLLYLRDVGKLPLWIGGILHAGSYVPHDRLETVSSWASGLEWGWFNAVDLIVVATQYHRELLWRRVLAHSATNLVVMPFPVAMGAQNYYGSTWTVAFPHRITPEKQPELFDELVDFLAKCLPDVRGIKTIQVAVSKDHYYTILGCTRLAFSAALEETFGIAMIEATTRGCIPLVPDSLAYAEQYPETYRYSSMGQAKSKAFDFLTNFAIHTSSHEYNELCAKFRGLHNPHQACKDIVSLVATKE